MACKKRPTLTSNEMPQPYPTATGRPDNRVLTSDAKIKEAEEKDVWDSKSITKSYHRLRFEELEGYVKNLNDYDKEKLKTDARRIQRSRVCLENLDAKELFLGCDTAFKDWRSDAEIKRDVKFKYPLSARARGTKSLDFVEDSIDFNEVSEADRDAAHDFNTGVLFFEKCGVGWRKATYHGNGFDEHEKFPNQKMTVHKALFDQNHNPFGVTKDKQERQYLKYIHLPSNHMEWVEVRYPYAFRRSFLEYLSIDRFVVQQAIARYHGEDLEPDTRKRKMTNQTLAREFWRGQVHGAGLDKHPIHARHLRTRCLSIDLGKRTVQHTNWSNLMFVR